MENKVFIPNYGWIKASEFTEVERKRQDYLMKCFEQALETEKYDQSYDDPGAGLLEIAYLGRTLRMSLEKHKDKPHLINETLDWICDDLRLLIFMGDEKYKLAIKGGKKQKKASNNFIKALSEELEGDKQ